ncbi:hypothetical protein NCCP28_02590 [Niallia sp. NCCP-28]|nr:hypothetical protein NCCP28_02590 [Niallia sp. NCCP-28]
MDSITIQKGINRINKLIIAYMDRNGCFLYNKSKHSIYVDKNTETGKNNKVRIYIKNGVII